MAFEKGHPRYGGRKKSTNSTPSIKTDVDRLRTVIVAFAHEAIPLAVSRFNEIEKAEDMFKVLTPLLKYIMPTLQATEIKDTTEEESLADEIRRLNKIAGL